MPKNDNPHALRLAAALRAHLGDSASEAIAGAHPLTKSADVEKKFRWACEVCESLEGRFGAQAAAIRRDCRCNDGRTMAKEIAGCIRKAGSLAGGCALFTEKNRYAFLEYINEHELIFGYHACVCSCVKRAEGSVLSGNERCAMRVCLPETQQKCSSATRKVLDKYSVIHYIMKLVWLAIPACFVYPSKRMTYAIQEVYI